MLKTLILLSVVSIFGVFAGLQAYLGHLECFEETDEKVDTLAKVKRQSVLVYSKAYCPYCLGAKRLLMEKGVAFEDVDIGNYPERKSEMIAKSGGGTTVPQIFIGDYHVGGYNELIDLDLSQKLSRLLAEHGINLL
jgi:glutaredoxin 3